MSSSRKSVTSDAPDDEPAHDIHAVLTDAYTWDERSLRVAALQQVLKVDVDGWYDADTRLVHLEFLEFIAFSIDGVPDVAPPGPSAEEWAALRDCESGGDYSIASSSGRYRGAYQFVQSTWDSVAERNDPALVGVDPAGGLRGRPGRDGLRALPRSGQRSLARVWPSPLLTLTTRMNGREIADALIDAPIVTSFSPLGDEARRRLGGWTPLDGL